MGGVQRNRRPVSVGDDLPGDLADHRGNLALKISHARFAGVAVDDLINCILAEAHIRPLEPVLFDLLRDDEPLCNAPLLERCVAGHLDDLHAIAERMRDLVESVGGGYEEHLREIERELEVMIDEPGVLLRVEDLEQGGGGVAAKVGAELIHLIEEEDRIVGSRLADGLHDFSREGAHVGAPVAPDFRLVADATEGNANEASAKAARHRAPEGGLPRSRRSHEAQNGPFESLL